ncbi:prolyl 3-hydroxylase 1 [Bufo gargarizans]|uniref:prolyl 3-hydroxylase 1 n=1 Tax=Bufo gargarizans TaxID=30331 RepID=UPI001CF23179|nr:prolyl 3-hydroxylase 1 [Bufo gargarizans]
MAAIASCNVTLKTMNIHIGSLKEDISIIRHDLHKVADQTTEVQRRVSDLEDGAKTLHDAGKATAKDIVALYAKTDDLENRSRQNNIRLVGVPEKIEGPNHTDFIEKWIAEKFQDKGLSAIYAVERAHRVPTRPLPHGRPPRPILAKILHYRDRDTVLRASSTHPDLKINGIHKLDKAVAAAHTFYVGNPDHLEMQQNLEYYKMMAGVSESDFRDLEAKVHMQEFRLGVSDYADEVFRSAIAYFEKALEEYLIADDECRSLCEGPYDYDGYNYLDYTADLFQSITDHYVQVMNCRQGCVSELAIPPGKEKPKEDFLASHFNYLQFAYHNTENYTKAIECAKTYLLFHPNDEVMNQNLIYYTAVLGEESASVIQPRESIQSYIKRSLLEKELLYFAYDIFGIPFVDPDTWTPNSVIPKRLREKQKMERETAARISEEIGNLMKEIENLVEEKTKESFDITKTVREGGPVLFDEVSVVMNSQTLNGSQRVVTDGIISEDECRELLRLTNAAASAGDGYRGTTSPHTPNEKFYGVTVYKALKLGQEGKVPLRSAHLYYNVTEKVRRVVESYFRLDSPLFFSYSHLVCRTAIEEKQAERKDLSHPVHVDNCILNAEALMCIKENPAYTFRDYSAILYLNGDFEGGHFYFTELDAKTVTAEVKPQCGRMVGFSSGAENPHGVKAVTKGQRCAVALWFTLDPRHNERERIQADDLIKMLFSPEETDIFAGNGSEGKTDTQASGEKTEQSSGTPPEAPTAPGASKQGVLGPPLDSVKSKTEL